MSEQQYDQMPEERRSFLNDILQSVGSREVARRVIPGRMGQIPEMHGGFSRGGAGTIHDMGRTKVAHAHDKYLIMGKRASKADVYRFLDEREEVDSPTSLANEAKLYMGEMGTPISSAEARALVKMWMKETGRTVDKDTFGAPIIVRKS